MPMTAANTEPIQGGQVQGAPTGAAILTMKKKKPLDNHDTRGKNAVQPHQAPPTGAAILARRK